MKAKPDYKIGDIVLQKYGSDWEILLILKGNGRFLGFPDYKCLMLCSRSNLRGLVVRLLQPFNASTLIVGKNEL